MNQFKHWSGKIRIKPKFNFQKLRDLPNGWFNFGEYKEAIENVVFEYMGEPNFAELNFNLRNKVGTLCHVKYMFHHGANIVDSDQLLLELNLRHICISSAKCIFLCDARVIFSSLMLPNEDDDIVDDFSFNIIIEFENVNKLDEVLKHLTKSLNIPIWNIQNKKNVGDIIDGNFTWEQLGRIELEYYKTLKFMEYKNEVHISVYTDNKKMNFSSPVSFVVMHRYMDYFISFDSQNKMSTHVLNTDDQMEDYGSFYGDFKGNAFYIENVLLFNGLILIFGRVKIDFSVDEYDYYKCCLSFKSSNLSFVNLSQHLNIYLQSYWNLQEVAFDGFEAQ
ncbi:MAG: hypothetical protein MH472_11680 [Bacteroidia bacterium]|nr:hypothetical protein [Bacteroidia bacterium]